MIKDGNLRSLFRQHLPKFHWTSIESPLTSAGIPDCEYCYDGRTGWIEYKTVSGWQVTLRPEQVGWLLRRSRAGGRAFIAVRRNKMELWLYGGADAALLRDKGMKHVIPLSRQFDGPARWDWNAIRALLLA